MRSKFELPERLYDEIASELEDRVDRDGGQDDLDARVAGDEQRHLSRPEVQEAIEDLCQRYRYPNGDYFAERLLYDMFIELNPKPPWWVADTHPKFIRLETDPPVRPAVTRWATLYPQESNMPGHSEVKLRSLKIVVEPWTTLEDIKAAWQRVETLQRRLPGYTERARRRRHLERDIWLFECYMNGMTVRQAVDFWNTLRPDQVIKAALASVSRSLNRLQKEMRPSPAPK